MKRPSGRHPLEAKGITKSYDGVTVIKNFTASVQRGEKIGLLGRNGTGKTTLLRSLMINAPAANDEPFTIDSGSVEWGHEVAVGFFAQDHKASIPPSESRSWITCKATIRRRATKNCGACWARCFSSRKKA